MSGAGGPRLLDGAERELLGRRWLRVPATDETELAEVERRTGVDLRRAAGSSVVEDGRFGYLPATLMMRDGDRFSLARVIFAISDDVLVTLEPDPAPPPFATALARLPQEGAGLDDPHTIMLVLLQALNDAADDALDAIGESIEGINVQIMSITGGLDTAGKEIGVSDISGTNLELGDAEEFLSHCLETQLVLARAARHLRARIGSTAPRSARRVEVLLSDIDAVEQHIAFEHDRVRFLQQSIITMLNVKQNQIVKVFSIVTAVFLPPTLISTFYSMNFATMPALVWEYGEPTVIALTLTFALLPLVYIKRKGWMR